MQPVFRNHDYHNNVEKSKHNEGDIQFGKYIRELYRHDKSALKSIIPYYDESRHNPLNRALKNEQLETEGNTKSPKGIKFYRRQSTKKTKKLN